MSDVLVLCILGLALGALYAGIGMGVVVTFRATGVINVGQVGLAMWGAYVSYGLQSEGELVLPWAGLPSRIKLGEPWAVWPSAVAGIVSASLVGALVHLLVFRPLRNAPQLARIVATVGLLFLSQALIVQQFGDGTLLPAPLLPTDIWQVSAGIPVDRFLLAALTVIVALSIAAAQRYTLVGLALRAGAEDETSAALAGWSPNILGVVGWGGGAAVSALFVILVAPSLGLSAATFPALLVPGLAVALVGRLNSVVATAVAGLVLGAFQSYVILLTAKQWWPSWAISGVGNALPFLVVVVVLFVAGRRLPARGEMITLRLPPVDRGRFPWTLAVVGLVVGVALLLGTAGIYRFGLMTSMIFAFFALSLVVITGLVGQVSLAQAAVAGVAAFVLVRITPGVPFPLNVVLAAVGATAAGLLAGLPALRIRHGQLAVVTLAGAVGVADVVFGNVSYSPTLPPPTLWGLDLSAQQGTEVARLPFGLLVLACLAMSCLVVARLTRGRWGRRFLAVRSNERAAYAAGIQVGRTKLMAFALSAFLAGVGGCLLAYSQGQASAPAFAVLVGLSIVVYAYLGGITSSAGAIAAGLMAPAGILFVLLDQRLDLGNWYALASAIALLASLVMYPNGVTGALSGLSLRAPNRKGRAATRDIPEPLHHQSRERGKADGEVLLAVRDVTVRYGGMVAVDQVTFEVCSGEIVGLIGPNGAGKTSLIDAITGFTPSIGDVLVAGRSLSRDGSAERYDAGLARTWQSPSLFWDLNVRDNVAVAARNARLGDLLRDVLGRKDRDAAVDHALVQAGAWPLAGLMPEQLSTGQQRSVALARAIVREPLVLLADEPAAGLDPDERPLLAERIRGLARNGAAVLLVEHDLDFVLGVCDRVVVIDAGRVIATGTPAQVRADPVVIAAYIGQAVHETVNTGAMHPKLTE
jgi:ABC-type branched-subunit amino acid transport system ATPase component/branched-subunit amino acid ABC-type transport system permease component